MMRNRTYLKYIIFPLIGMLIFIGIVFILPYLKWQATIRESFVNGEIFLKEIAPVKPDSRIDLTFAKPFKLADVLQAYGNPSHVDAAIYHSDSVQDANGHSAITYDLVIIYLPQGLKMELRSNSKPVLGPDLSFNKLSFFVPGRAGYAEAFRFDKWLKLWQGFIGYDAYCYQVTGLGSYFC